LTADVIHEAVTDGKPGKVRYYTGPDGMAITRVKQLLGEDWYWQEFRAFVSGNPTGGGLRGRAVRGRTDDPGGR